MFKIKNALASNHNLLITHDCDYFYRLSERMSENNISIYPAVIDIFIDNGWVNFINHKKNNKFHQLDLLDKYGEWIELIQELIPDDANY